MSKPRFSIIIPLYNKEQTIERTIRGILNQTFSDFEIVIVNDGSTDNSVNIVESIENSRIKLIHQENAGPSAARNTGVRHTNADWIVFLDADDEILEDALEYYDKTINANPQLDILDCNKYNKVKDSLTPCYHPIDGWVKNNMRECYYGKISPGAGFSVFRKTLIEKHPYNESIRRYEDAEWLIRLLKHAKVYSSTKITSIHDNNFAEASNRRKDIAEDYVGHLSFRNKSFWQKMCVYRTFLEERNNYPIECKQLYKSWYCRYDLLVIYKLLNFFKKFF